MADRAVRQLALATIGTECEFVPAPSARAPKLLLQRGPLVVVSPEELQRLVREAVRAERVAAMPGPSEVLSRAQVAALLGLRSIDMVTRLVKQRGLPAVKLARVWRFRRSEVLAWFESQKGVGRDGSS